jgi:outer membrane protein assembly factor BamB
MKFEFGFIVLLAATALSANAADWPRWRGPDQNGISKETAWTAQWPASGPKQLWKAKVGTGFSSFSVSNGRLYTMGNVNSTDSIICLNADTGTEVWKKSYPAPLDPNLYEGGPNATPTVDGDRVYTLSRRGVVHCIEAAKGNIIWSTNLGTLKPTVPDWGFSGGVMVEGDLCLLNLGTTGTALDKKTGKVVWFSGTEKAGYTTPLLAPGGAAIFAAKQDIVAVNIKDGKVLWRYPWKTAYDVNAADPILTGKQLFVSSGYGHGSVLLDLSSGTPTKVWENKNMRNQFNPSVLIDGHLYGIDDDTSKRATLRCVELKTGELQWTEPTGFGSLIAANGKLIVLSAKGELMVADASPAGFKPTSRAQVLTGKCWTTPVLANGKIYCRNAVGDVVCLDVSGK